MTTLAPIRTRPAHARAVTGSAGVYVTAWVAGLLAAPPAPGLDATAVELHDHVVANGGALAVQSALVHGVAGLALAVLAVALSRRLPGRGVRLAGVAAASLSLLQVGLLQWAVWATSAAAPERIGALLGAVGRVDSLKLVALALFVGGVLRGSRQPGWVRGVGLVLVPLLPVSGLAFVLGSQPLYVLLYASLPLLLVWVAATAASWTRTTVPAPPRSPNS